MNEIDFSGLLDRDPDTQQRASSALYDSADLSDFRGDSEVARALRSSVAAENKSAAAILLLGYDPSPEAMALLKEVRADSGTRMAKLRSWTVAVPLALVIDVSLSRLGDSGARIALLEEIERAEVDVLAFLLGVLREVADPPVLHAISRALDDERTVSGGLPSGAGPARRLADVAVDAFVERLGLAIGFELEPSRRYSEPKIAEVKQLINAGLPR